MTPTNYFKSLVWDALVSSALNALFRAVPLLGWGPVGYVLSFAVVSYSDFLFRGVNLYIGVEQIVIKNEELRKAFETAYITLNGTAKTFGITSNEFKEQHEKAKQYLSNFVRIGPR